MMTKSDPLDIEPGASTPTNVLNNAVGDLADIRRNLSKAKIQLKIEEKILHATDPWHDVASSKAAVKIIKDIEKLAADGIRELALEVAIELETPNPVDGIKVVKKKTSLINDDDAALAYVRERQPELLTFDERALVKILEAMPEKARPDFFYTEVVEFGTVRIASDLDEVHPPRLGGSDDDPQDTPF